MISGFMMNITWCLLPHSSHCRCSLGYYGDPQLPGGSCHLCQCNPSGSVHVNCDRVTGKCPCKQGVTGQLCEECEPRHLLLEEECVCRWLWNCLLLGFGLFHGCFSIDWSILSINAWTNQYPAGSCLLTSTILWFYEQRENFSTNYNIRPAVSP